MEDFRINYDEARNFLFSGACTLADMDREGRTVLYGRSEQDYEMGGLSYAFLGLALVGIAGKLVIDAHKEKGLSIPGHLLLAGGAAAAGVGLIGYSLVNAISQ